MTSKRVLDTWAKAEILDGIDRTILDIHIAGLNRDADSQDALTRQRNRVAKFLGFPEISHDAILRWALKARD